MFNYKSTLALGTMLLLPFSVFADTCATLPKCADLGFVYSASDCGSLNKLKCPFDDTSYFCSANTCKSVSVGRFEKCTKTCDDDPNICVDKRAMTCDEALAVECPSYSNRYTDGRQISGTITGQICIKGTIQQSSTGSLELAGANVWAAEKLYAGCKTEMGDTKSKLNLRYVTLKNNVSFYTDVDIETVNFYNNSSSYWSASFYGNSTVRVYYSAAANWSNELNLNFATYSDDETFTSKVYVYCGGGSDNQWNPAKCSVNAHNYYENHAVALCGQIYSDGSYCGSSGTCYKELDLTCNNQENSSEMCTIGDSYSAECLGNSYYR